MANTDNCCFDIYVDNCNKPITRELLAQMVASVRKPDGSSVDVSSLPDYPTYDDILSVVPTAVLSYRGFDSVDGIKIDGSYTAGQNQLVRVCDVTVYSTTITSFELKCDGESGCGTAIPPVVDCGCDCNDDKLKVTVTNFSSGDPGWWKEMIGATFINFTADSCVSVDSFEFASDKTSVTVNGTSYNNTELSIKNVKIGEKNITADFGNMCYAPPVNYGLYRIKWSSNGIPCSSKEVILCRNGGNGADCCQGAACSTLDISVRSFGDIDANATGEVRLAEIIDNVNGGSFTFWNCATFTVTAESNGLFQSGSLKIKEESGHKYVYGTLINGSVWSAYVAVTVSAWLEGQSTACDSDTFYVKKPQSQGECEYDYKILKYNDSPDTIGGKFEQTLSPCEDLGLASVKIYRKCQTSSIWYEITESVWESLLAGDGKYDLEVYYNGPSSEQTFIKKNVSIGTTYGDVNYELTGTNTGASAVSRVDSFELALVIDGTEVDAYEIVARQNAQTGACACSYSSSDITSLVPRSTAVDYKEHTREQIASLTANTNVRELKIEATNCSNGPFCKNIVSQQMAPGVWVIFADFENLCMAPKGMTCDFVVKWKFKDCSFCKEGKTFTVTRDGNNGNDCCSDLTCSQLNYIVEPVTGFTGSVGNEVKLATLQNLGGSYAFGNCTTFLVSVSAGDSSAFSRLRVAFTSSGADVYGTIAKEIAGGQQWTFQITPTLNNTVVSSCEKKTFTVKSAKQNECDYDYKILKYNDSPNTVGGKIEQTLSPCEDGGLATVKVYRKCPTSSTWDEITESVWESLLAGDGEYELEVYYNGPSSEDTFIKKNVSIGTTYGDVNYDLMNTNTGASAVSRVDSFELALVIDGTVVYTYEIVVHQNAQAGACNCSCSSSDITSLVPRSTAVDYKEHTREQIASLTANTNVRELKIEATNGSFCKNIVSQQMAPGVWVIFADFDNACMAPKGMTCDFVVKWKTNGCSFCKETRTFTIARDGNNGNDCCSDLTCSQLDYIVVPVSSIGGSTNNQVKLATLQNTGTGYAFGNCTTFSVSVSAGDSSAFSRLWVDGTNVYGIIAKELADGQEWTFKISTVLNNTLVSSCKSETFTVKYVDDNKCPSYTYMVVQKGTTPDFEYNSTDLTVEACIDSKRILVDVYRKCNTGDGVWENITNEVWGNSALYVWVKDTGDHGSKIVEGSEVGELYFTIPYNYHIGDRSGNAQIQLSVNGKECDFYVRFTQGGECNGAPDWEYCDCDDDDYSSSFELSSPSFDTSYGYNYLHWYDGDTSEREFTVYGACGTFELRLSDLSDGNEYFEVTSPNSRESLSRDGTKVTVKPKKVPELGKNITTYLYVNFYGEKNNSCVYKTVFLNSDRTICSLTLPSSAVTWCCENYYKDDDAVWEPVGSYYKSCGEVSATTTTNWLEVKIRPSGDHWASIDARTKEGWRNTSNQNISSDVRIYFKAHEELEYGLVDDFIRVTVAPCDSCKCDCESVAWPTTDTLTWNTGDRTTKTLTVTANCGSLTADAVNGFSVSVGSKNNSNDTWTVTITPTVTTVTTSTLKLKFNSDNANDCTDVKNVTLKVVNPAINVDSSGLNGCGGGTVKFSVSW